MCACVRIFARACVHVRVCANVLSLWFMFMFMCVCVHVCAQECVCEREKEREKERERKRESVCVCIELHIYICTYMTPGDESLTHTCMGSSHTHT